jgi:hypothetical protein
LPLISGKSKKARIKQINGRPTKPIITGTAVESEKDILEYPVLFTGKNKKKKTIPEVATPTRIALVEKNIRSLFIQHSLVMDQDWQMT